MDLDPTSRTARIQSLRRLTSSTPAAPQPTKTLEQTSQDLATTILETAREQQSANEIEILKLAPKRGHEDLKRDLERKRKEGGIEELEKRKIVEYVKMHSKGKRGFLEE